MRQYQVGVTAGVAAGGYAALYRLGQTWGATEEEQRKALAGDELLPDARARTTHAGAICSGSSGPIPSWPATGSGCAASASRSSSRWAASASTPA